MEEQESIPFDVSKYVDIDNAYIYIYGEVDEEMSRAISVGVNKIISIYGENPIPAIVYINSCGGDLAHGIDIIASLKRLAEVRIDITGQASSMAAIIACIGLGKVRMYKYATLMFHGPSISAESLPIKDIEKYTKWINQCDKIILEDICKKEGCKLTYKTLQKRIIAEKDYFIDASTALKLGLVDEIY